MTERQEKKDLKTWDAPPAPIQYCMDHSDKLTQAQNELIEASKNVRMNKMLSSSDELQLLANICRAIGAKNTLDIGTFTGYSALTIAASLPKDGRVVAMDVSDENAEICRKYWAEAGVANKIDYRIASAADTLDSLLKAHGEGSFDFAFIDADKANYKTYYEYCLRLIRSGGVIAIDNALFGLKVLDESIQDKCTVAIRELNKFIVNDDRVNVSMLWLGDGTSLVFKK